MIYLLDTNSCIHALRTKSNALVKARLASAPASDLAVCTIVVGELYYGAERSANVAAERSKVDSFILPYTNLLFDATASSIYGTIRADLAIRALLIGPLDMLIAAIALANNLTLVTH